MDHQIEGFTLARQEVFRVSLRAAHREVRDRPKQRCLPLREGEIDALLVVAMPGTVHINWVTDEIPQHLPPIPALSGVAGLEDKTKAFNKRWRTPEFSRSLSSP